MSGGQRHHTCGRGGEKTGPSPVDRRKPGSKHHILTDGNGIPIVAHTTAANQHDDLERPHVGQADLTDVVITANLCAYWNELGDDFDWTAVTAANRLKLGQDAIAAILKASEEEIQSIMKALS